MKKHRIISLIMILLLMIPTLSACGEFKTSVEMIGSDGTPVTCRAEFIASKQGSKLMDGELMFMPVSEYLPYIVDDIPFVTLGSAPEIRVTAGRGVSFRGGDVVDVYSEDYQPLAVDVPLAELTARGESDWAGQTVYLFFVIDFYRSNGDYEMTGCFVKTAF